MWVIPKEAAPELVRGLILDKLRLSRFHARVELDAMSGGTRGVKISVVRLKRRSTHYCGQHPGPCQVQPGLPRRGRTGSYFLEGLDWVGFNALVNDALDARGVSADVFSYNRESWDKKYFIRRGTERRVKYPYRTETRDYGTTTVEIAGWVQGGKDCFEDFCGRECPPPDQHTFPEGTPGIPAYTLEAEDRLRGAYTGDHQA